MLGMTSDMDRNDPESRARCQGTRKERPKLIAGHVLFTSGDEVAFTVRVGYRAKIAARLEWHAIRIDRSAQLRAAPWIVPVQRVVDVHFAAMVSVAETIFDILVSGAAVGLHTNPSLSTEAQVRIGARHAGVVNAIEGIWVGLFGEPLTFDGFDDWVCS